MSNKSLLITLEYPPQIGGIGTYYKHIVKMAGNIDVLHLEAKKKFSWATHILPVFRKILKKNYDFLQIGHILPLGYIGLLSKSMLKRPYVVYVHGTDICSEKLTSWKKFWIRAICAQSEHIIVNSKFTKNQLIARHKALPDKIIVFYPVLPVYEIEREASLLKPLDRPINSKIILSVGRLIPRKGFDSTIKALSLLRDKPYEYWIIGKGQDFERLSSIIKLEGLSDRVKLLGPIAPPDLYRYFKACDLFVMASRDVDTFGDLETFGIVYLEAAIFKKPVIGGRTAGVPEAIVDGKTGLLVDPQDSDQLASAIEQILENDTLRREMGERGYERVCSEFAI